MQLGGERRWIRAKPAPAKAGEGMTPVVTLICVLALQPLGAQVRTADPFKRGLQLTQFPRVVKLAENVYVYEEIRSPGFTTVSLFVQRFVPGRGFIEEPAASREELAAFRTSLNALIGEVKRLHALGLSLELATSMANWGEYKDWFLADQQASIAVRRGYDEIEGRLK